MKFDVGDRFRVIENGLTGLIAKRTVNYCATVGVAETEYEVRWDSWHVQNTYMAHDVDHLWEKIDKIADGVNTDAELPPGLYGGIYGGFYGEETTKKSCDHKWVEVGFTHSKIVCYHCDMEKP